MKSDSDLAKEIREIYAEGTPASIRQLMQRLGYVSEGGSRRRVMEIVEEQGLPRPVGRPGYAKVRTSASARGTWRPFLHVWEGAKL